MEGFEAPRQGAAGAVPSLQAQRMGLFRNEGWSQMGQELLLCCSLRAGRVPEP